MMIRSIITSLALICASSTFAQRILVEKAIQLKRGFEDTREAYPVMDSTSQQLTLFLVDKNTIKALLFDKNLVLMDSLETTRPEGKFQDLLGHTRSNNGYHLVFAVAKRNELFVVSCDFVNKKIKQTPIELPFQKEKYAVSASYLGNFYLLTVKKGTSVLTLYAFTGEADYTVHTFDFKKEVFVAPPYSTLFDATRETRIESIDNQMPNSIETVVKKSKLYCFNNTMFLTFDNLYLNTKIITIDLKTFDSELKKYKKSGPSECSDIVNTSSNSYLYQGNLYQFLVCGEGMELSITSLTSGEKLKKFQIVKDDDLYIKNTSVIQTMPSMYTDGERELNKTKQFLRKAAAGDVGVCVYQNSTALEVTLGGQKAISSGPSGGALMSTQGSAVAVPGGGVVRLPSISYPTYSGYVSYKATKSVQFKSKLALNTFEHLDGSLNDNAFDRMRDFTTANEDEITAQTVFKRKGIFVLGYYVKSKGIYVMRSFE